MDTVYCVTVTDENLEGPSTTEFFVCKNLDTAKEILRREYEKGKREFLDSYEEGDPDAYFDTEILRQQDFVLYTEDIFNRFGNIEEKPILNFRIPSVRITTRNRLRQLMKEKE